MSHLVHLNHTCLLPLVGSVTVKEIPSIYVSTTADMK